MPKRTNEFQQLIYMIESQLAPENAKVTQSKELINSRTNKPREVDIVIECIVGTHTITIGIEVTSTTRPASSQWVETMIGKHKNLPINQSILVSKSGFYEPAKELAEKEQFKMLTLSQAEKLDWLKHINKLKEINTVSLLVPSLTRVNLVFNEDIEVIQKMAIEKDKIKDLILFLPDETPTVSVINHINQFLHSPSMYDKLKQIPDEGGFILELEYPLKEGVYVLDKKDRKHKLHSIKCIAKFKIERSVVPLDRASYGDAQIAHGTGDTFGRKIITNLAELPDKPTSIVIAVEVKKK